jgi:hypothetical protein
VSQESGVWPGSAAFVSTRLADDKALEAVFESMGQDSVHRLVSVPHPFGLVPQDRRAAQRWLSRQVRAQRHRELTIVLSIVAAGLAAAIVLLGLASIL